MFALLLSLLTFRNILLLFCLLNLKNLPLAWELRLIYRGYQSWKSKRDVARILRDASTTQQQQPSALPPSTLPASSHPIFAPLTISTITPQLEIDHNLHKSNSTYFSDLDESRTALMVHLLSSTRFSPAELDREGYKGPFSIILGSVHTSFLREIKPYERYSIRSRILGWDNKWILIHSVFVRPKTTKDRQREAKEQLRKANTAAANKTNSNSNTEQSISNPNGAKEEILLATCLSKYVVKKGRFTVPPERCFRSAGWLPEKPVDAETPPITLDTSASPTPTLTSEALNSAATITESDLRRRVQANAAKAAESLRSSTTTSDNDAKAKSRPEKDDNDAERACHIAASRWKWDDIDDERRRGLEVAEHWLRLDGRLKELWEGEGKL